MRINYLKKSSFSILFILTFCIPVKAISAEVEFIYVGSQEHSALLGAKQGIDEANLQGEFLNKSYNLDVISEEDITNTDFAKYIAVLTAVDIDTFTNLSAKLSDKPIFNLSLKNTSLRTECIANALHTIPSEKMYIDAQSQWNKKKSESNAKAQGWHPDFVKFAARDLNKRFKKSHGIAMDDYSYAGWAAVKMTSDAVVRTNITNSTEMLNYLKTDLSFDGQKGSNMNFRETGQLRQLMLLVENDKIVSEAPVRGVAKPPTLDSLGILNCEK